MSKRILCRGEHCPVKKQCKWFRCYVSAIAEGNVNQETEGCCINQKRFVRDKADHPQMYHGNYPRGC